MSLETLIGFLREVVSTTLRLVWLEEHSERDETEELFWRLLYKVVFALSILSSHACSVCDEPIVESSPGVAGDQALQCDGACMGWLHRRCAGVSASQYAILSDSEEPFCCVVCAQREMREVISLLRSEVKALKLEVDRLNSAPALDPSVVSQSKAGICITHSCIPPL